MHADYPAYLEHVCAVLWKTSFMENKVSTPQIKMTQVSSSFFYLFLIEKLLHETQYFQYRIKPFPRSTLILRKNGRTNKVLGNVCVKSILWKQENKKSIVG